MKNFTLRLLSGITVLFGLAGIALCIFALPAFPSIIPTMRSELAFLQYPVWIGVYAAATAYFIALYQFMRFITFCVKNEAYSREALSSLHWIRVCAIVFSVLYLLSAMPVVFLAADAEDAPGLILIGLLFDAIPVGVAAFATLLEMLLSEKR